MFKAFPAIQAEPLMHDGGMLMGVHWLWVVFWAVVVGVLIWAMARMAADRRETRARLELVRQAEGDLRTRLANGDIDREEYERALTALRAGLQGSP